MQIKYTNTFDDLLSFNRYVIDNTKSIQKMLNKNKWVSALSVFLLLSLLCYQISGTYFVLVFGFVVAVLMFFAVPRVQRNSIDKNLVKMLKEGKHLGFLCEHILSIDEGALREETPVDQLITKCEGIQEIVEYKEYLLILVDTNRGHVIPKDRIDSGNLDVFISELKLKIPSKWSGD